MNETRVLADHLSSTRFDDLPAVVVETAKLCVLDILGVGIVAGRRPWSEMAMAVVVDSGGEPRSTVWGRGVRTTPQQAALLNGTAAHGIEMDDRRPSVRVHPGSVAVPAALAVTESVNANGQELIAAVVSGYELGLRVGHAVRLRAGIHSAGHTGVWTSVGAAGRGLGLSPGEMCNAMGIAGSMAAGLAEFTQDSVGTMVKRLHGGMSAHNGVMAARLAGEGFTGPGSVLEGVNGYCRTYAQSPDHIRLDQLVDGLGTDFFICKREVKPYAAWGGSHTSIEAVGTLMSDHGISADDVERIVIGAARYLIDEHEDAKPRSLMAAQYSLPFVTAIAAVRGPLALVDPDEIWTEDVLDDDAILAMASRVGFYVDAELDDIYLNRGHYGDARVTITTKSGAEYTKLVNDSKGTSKNPMTSVEIEAKFRRLCSRVLPEQRTQQIIDMVSHLDELPDVRILGDLVAGPEAR